MRIVLWNGTDEINIPKLRNQGYLIFLCSEEPYFYAYKNTFAMLTGLSQTKDIMHIWDAVKYWLICHTNI